MINDTLLDGLDSDELVGDGRDDPGLDGGWREAQGLVGDGFVRRGLAGASRGTDPLRDVLLEAGSGGGGGNSSSSTSNSTSSSSAPLHIQHTTASNVAAYGELVEAGRVARVSSITFAKFSGNAVGYNHTNVVASVSLQHASVLELLQLLNAKIS